MKKDCPFCQSGKNPDYKSFDELKDFISDQGKIQKQLRTGLCSKHQRKLAQAIKRARFLGLVPFTARV